MTDSKQTFATIHANMQSRLTEKFATLHANTWKRAETVAARLMNLEVGEAARGDLHDMKQIAEALKTIENALRHLESEKIIIRTKGFVQTTSQD